MFTEKEMSDALKWLFDLFQPEDYEAYDEEEVGCAALCLPEVCMALRDKAETAYEYVVKTNIDRGFEYRGKELFMQRACLIYSDRDAPPAHAGQQHNDTEQHPADGKHTEFFDFGEEQHHRNTAHKRHDHADKRNENRDKTDGRRSENDDKINRRENTDIDEILSLQFVVHCETS